MGLAYRLVREEDFPGVQRLWKEEAGWGAFAEEMWQRYVVEAPRGGISGTVATDTDTGRIVGQFAFVPSLVSVDGRDSRTLPWKLGEARHELMAVERAGELVGLTASRRRKGEEQWLVCDLLAADDGDCLRATLAAAANLAHVRALESASSEKPIRKMTVLATPVMEPVVRGLGFARDAYDFPLVVHVLDPSLKEDVHPSRWFVSAND